MPSENAEIRILLVDDHAAIREGLWGMLAFEPDLEPVAAASSVREAFELAERTPADVALLDYHLPDGDGLSLCLRMQSWRRSPRTVIYSAFADETLTVLAVVAGADAVVGKASAPEQLCETLRAVARGESQLWAPTPTVSEGVAARLDAEDMPILGMLLHRIPAAEIAETLAVDESWLSARRWAILERLRGRPSRRSRPPHEPLFGATTPAAQPSSVPRGEVEADRRWGARLR